MKEITIEDGKIVITDGDATVRFSRSLLQRKLAETEDMAAQYHAWLEMLDAKIEERDV